MRTLSVEPPLAHARLEVDSLTAGYGATAIVNNISLSANDGDVAVIIGPNGSGKSTVLKALMGVIRCMGGRVLLDGVDIVGRRTDQIAALGIGFVPQVKDVFDPLTVAENLDMGGYLVPRRDIAGRVEEVLSVFPRLSGLLGRRAGNLSGGERKMLAIGRVLMAQPQLLLLDEPTANLSPQLADEFLREHVVALAASGRAVLLVEQRAIAALSIGSYGYVMVGGRIEMSGPACALSARGDIGELFLGLVS